MPYAPLRVLEQVAFGLNAAYLTIFDGLHI
jgi:hypothetical protein